MSKIKILGIAASPRRMTTDYIVDYALKAAAEENDVETELFSLAKKKIAPCIACPKCTYPCVQKDDMLEVYEKIRNADGIIFGSPVYWGSVTAQAKAFIDRLRPFCLYSKHLETSGALKNKAVGAVTIAYDRNGGQEFTLLTILQAFLMHDALVVSSGDTRPIGCYYGGSSVQWPNSGLEALKKDEIGLISIRTTAKRVVDVARMIKKAKGEL